VARALIICGPTSSGKSEIALRLATQLDGEIVNADSRQIYRGMTIGSGLPPRRAFDLVAHHLYSFVDPAQRYSAARYVVDADAAIADICARGHLPLVVGGTGFYIEALMGTMTLDRPPGDDALRERLHAEARAHPAGVLWEWLSALRPSLAQRTRPNDSYRILRALESVLAQRDATQFSAHGAVARRAPDCEVVTLRVDRDVLRARIARRTHGMFADGLISEAQALRAGARGSPALSGLGYAEALAFVDGLASHAEALDRTIRRTVRYAKRQETWFRRIRGALVVDAQDEEAAVTSITALAREKLSPA
jgi:tRNA dimethylallyltransferase